MRVLQEAIQARAKMAEVPLLDMPLERMGKGESFEASGMRYYRSRPSFYQRHEEWVLGAIFMVFLGGALAIILWLGGQQ